jgi:RNA polymerase sigma factor for flagellar operon FliA
MLVVAETIDNIVDQYLPKIRYYAYKMSLNLPTELSRDDLISAGIVGLLEALKRYDREREASLKTFSDCRIKGAIIDEIRSMQWTSRSLRKKLSDTRDTYRNLEDKLSRPPSDAEVADEMGISVDKLQEVLLTSNMNNLWSLQDPVINKDGEVKELIDYISSDKETDPSKLFEIKECRKKLTSAIKKLTLREQLVVRLYYYEELTLKEIGNIIGLTESRICQLLNETILKLREEILS